MKRTNTVDYTVTHRNLIWGIGTLVLFLIVSSRGQMFVPKMILPFFGLFLATLITVIWATNKAEAVYESVNAFVAMVFIYVASTELRDRVNVLIKTFVLLALGLGVYGAYEYYLNPGYAWVSVRIGTMGNMNLCSSAHVLLIPFSLYALRYSWAWKAVSFLAILSALFVIFTLRSRSVWIALFVITILTARNRKLLITALLISMIALCAMFYIKGRVIFNTSSIMQRSQLWKQTLNMAKDHPFGVGAGNWSVEMPLYAHNLTGITGRLGFKSQQWGKAHNDFLENWSEIGIAGALLYISIFVSGIYYAVKKRNRLAYKFLAAYIVIACFSFPMQRPFHRIVMLSVMAITATLYKPRPLKLKPRTLYLLNILILAGLSFSVYVYSVRYVTEQRMYIVHRAKRAKDWNAVLYYTSNVSRFATLDYFNTPILSYRGIANFNKGNYEIALRNQWDAFWHNPNHIYPLVNIPVCLNVLNRAPEALAWYEKIMPMFPNYKEIENRYMDTYLREMAKKTNGPYR